MTWTLLVPGRLPGLNEIIDGRAHASKGWSAYNSLKQKWAGQVVLLARARGLAKLGSGYFSYLFVEPTLKRDPSNIVSGGVKVLEDALVKGGLLENDGWSNVLGFAGYWRHDPGRAGCLIHWSPTEIQTKGAMEALLEKELESGNSINGYRASGNEPHRAQVAKAARGCAKPRRQLGRYS